MILADSIQLPDIRAKMCTIENSARQPQFSVTYRFLKRLQFTSLNGVQELVLRASKAAAHTVCDFLE